MVSIERNRPRTNMSHIEKIWAKRTKKQLKKDMADYQEYRRQNNIGQSYDVVQLAKDLGYYIKGQIE